MEANKTAENFLQSGEVFLNQSWINGHYSCGNIDTSLGTVEVFDEDGFFVQGERAWEIIAEIHRIWLKSDLTNQQAFQLWITQNF